MGAGERGAEGNPTPVESQPEPGMGSLASLPALGSLCTSSFGAQSLSFSPPGARDLRSPSQFPGPLPALV